MSESAVDCFSFSDLPQEILVKIFSYYVKSTKISHLIRVLSRVCQSWRNATNCSSLWLEINDSNLSLNTILSLCKKGTLSLTQRINLSYEAKKLEPSDFQVIVEYCPKLRSVDLSCGKKTSLKALSLLSNSCELESVTLKSCESCVNASSLIPMLQSRGQFLTSLNFSCNTIFNFRSIMTAIANSCPELDNLSFLNIDGSSLCFPITKFQQSCPKLRVLELGSVEYHHTNEVTNGFPLMQSFCCGVFEKGPNDADLERILSKSIKLKHLDIRNCTISHRSLLNIPATDLESLYLSGTAVASDERLKEVLLKWSHSLKDLNLSRSKNFSVLNSSLNALLDTPHCQLEELNLSNSVIAFTTIKRAMQKCNKLHYLDLESCRELPRGIKRIYPTSIETDAFRKKMKGFEQ